ncbi:MAG: PorV/PorQ family protein [Candidatus Latescibacteria bacterium]|nr:PorV/PorQ family protein [Candidatus Latescibacterota bacterium]
MKNRNIKIFVLFAICCMLFANLGYGAFTKLGMAGMPFLKIGVGRANGMGDAFVAIADDASATYWNPAGLALLKNREVMLNHIDWVLETRLEYLAGAFPTKLGTFGFALTSVNYGEFEQTTIDNYQGTGVFFSAADMAFSASYARMFTDKFAFGGSIKAMQQRIWDMSANAFAFDLGTYYNTGWQNVRLAMTIANFGPDASFSGTQLNFDVDYPEGYTWPWTITPIPATYATEKFLLPIIFRFGIAYDIIKIEDKTSLTLAADLTHYNDVNEKVSIGLEYQYLNFALRGGYIINTDGDYRERIGASDGLSFGAGAWFKPTPDLKLNVDYAYRNLSRLGISHRVSLNVGF